MKPADPLSVMPDPVAAAVADTPGWFVIGGQAVRCYLPYRPSRDVDFGTPDAGAMNALLNRFRQSGEVVVLEQSADTVHLQFNRIKVSIFVLETLTGVVASRCLTIEGLLATKAHAIISRGVRRDFFDLYMLLQHSRQGLAACLDALRAVYRQEINNSLVLRAFTYFDEADREAPLPGEGKRDWDTVKSFFSDQAARLVVPPSRPLAIFSRRV